MSRPPWIVAVLCGLAIMLTPAAAVAAPAQNPSAGAEGGDPALIKKLDDTNRAYIDAQNALNASKERQTVLAAQQADLEPQYTRLRADTQQMSIAAYQNGGGLRSAATLL